MAISFDLMRVVRCFRAGGAKRNHKIAEYKQQIKR